MYYISSWISDLKVDSCPNNVNSVHFFLFSMQDFAENSCFFVCLFPLCWNFDSKNSFATCP